MALCDEALIAPVTSTCLQGVFRGLQDARTPFYATLACNALNIALEPPFIFKPLHLGVQGSALATALAQTLPLAALLIVLQRRYKLRFRGLDMQQVGAMFAPTGFLLLRTVSISAVFAAATALVARAGPLAAAAHQVSRRLLVVCAAGSKTLCMPAVCKLGYKTTALAAVSTRTTWVLVVLGTYCLHTSAHHQAMADSVNCQPSTHQQNIPWEIGCDHNAVRSVHPQQVPNHCLRPGLPLLPHRWRSRYGWPPACWRTRSLLPARPSSLVQQQRAISSMPAGSSPLPSSWPWV